MLLRQFSVNRRVQRPHALDGTEQRLLGELQGCTSVGYPHSSGNRPEEAGTLQESNGLAASLLHLASAVAFQLRAEEEAQAFGVALQLFDDSGGLCGYARLLGFEVSKASQEPVRCCVAVDLEGFGLGGRLCVW